MAKSDPEIEAGTLLLKLYKELLASLKEQQKVVLKDLRGD